MNDFIIEKGVLTSYVGEGGDVVIPDGVTAIGANVFFGNTDLRSVVIPDSVERIGHHAFYLCTQLVHATLPDSLETIEPSVFGGCISLASFRFPSNLKSIGMAAFWRCISLSSVTIPDGAVSIGRTVFYECVSLSSVTLPDSLKKVGMCAFDECDALQEIHASDGVFPLLWNRLSQECQTQYCYRRLLDGSTLRKHERHHISRIMNDLVKLAIENNETESLRAALAIKKTVPLTDLDRWINESECAVPVRFFLIDYKNKHYSTKRIEQLEARALEKELGLRPLSVADWKAVFKFTVKNGEITITGIHKASPTLDIPPFIGKSRVTAIGVSAFSECGEITSVTIPEGVTKLDKLAFFGCKNLQSVTLPSSLQIIEAKAFEGCVSLSSITIPDAVTTIGWCAFNGCTALADITVGKGVAAIGDAAFFNTPWLSGQPDLVVINHVLHRYNGIARTVVIPDSVTVIGDSAFKNCHTITSVVIPDHVTSIERCAFERCQSLRALTISDKTTSFGTWIFAGCNDLVIHGKAGSCAQTYANDNHVSFETE